MRLLLLQESLLDLVIGDVLAIDKQHRRTKRRKLFRKGTNEGGISKFFLQIFDFHVLLARRTQGLQSRVDFANESGKGVFWLLLDSEEVVEDDEMSCRVLLLESLS